MIVVTVRSQKYEPTLPPLVQSENEFTPANSVRLEESLRGYTY